MIADREKEIRQFVPQNYYGLEAKGAGITFIWHDKRNNTRTFQKERIEQLEKQLKNEHLIVEEVTIKNKKSYAPALYDLNELQRDASRKFHFSPKETLNIMQRLYEHYKILTYPRTDSRYLTDDIVPTIAERLRSCGVGPYRKLAASLLKQPIKPNKSFVNNQKVTDHHAIIPTEQFVNLTDLSSEERKIYDLVVRRFFAVLMRKQKLRRKYQRFKKDRKS
jgi:DNA topoisomerase-3